MSRSVKKGPYCDNSLLRKVDKIFKFKKKTLKTWSRRSTILPEFLGLTILVHNGNKFLPVHISEGMIGHKLGEFSLTRNFKSHPIAKNKKKVK